MTALSAATMLVLMSAMAGPQQTVSFATQDGSAHAQYIFETDQGDRLMREILRFLSER